MGLHRLKTPFPSIALAVPPTFVLLPDRGPAPGAELAGDRARSLADRRREPAGGSARQDPLGVAHHADRAHGVAGVVPDRRCDARLAEHGLVALAGHAAL